MFDEVGSDLDWCEKMGPIWTVFVLRNGEQSLDVFANSAESLDFVAAHMEDTNEWTFCRKADGTLEWTTFNCTITQAPFTWEGVY